MKLYETDFRLKNKNNQFEKWSNGDYIIYSESAIDEEIIHKGDEWIRTTELSSIMQKKLIKQLETRMSDKYPMPHIPTEEEIEDTKEDTTWSIKHEGHLNRNNIIFHTNKYQKLYQKMKKYNNFIKKVKEQK